MPRQAHASFTHRGNRERMNTAGNERLTAAVGLLLLAPVAVEVVTILLGVHTFMSVHVFVGLALIRWSC
jgi:hypothetical protein